MTQYLPPNLLALFAPRDPIPFLAPLDKLPHEKKSQNYHGVADFLKEFEDPKDTPPPTRVETKDEKKERKRKERAEQVAYKLEQDLALWDPSTDINSTGDPYKTLFVARTNYDTSESKLRREFEQYGPVKSIFLATNQRTGKPRGFAFVEFEHERDMHSAYKHADGKKIDGRRVLVDIERGRTIKGWRPRRLGGGLGGTRKGGPDVNAKYSGRDDTIARERSRSPKGGERERSRSRSPRRRKRSRSRERRRRRSRSKDRSERRRSRSPRERPERPDRADRPERPERPERPDRADRPERPDRPERSERRRSRSRDRKRRRSRSREPRRRSRSPRERRPAPEEPAAEPVFGEPAFGAMPDGHEEIMTFSIKQEPDYTGYGDSGASGDQAYEEAPPGFTNGNGQDAANE